MDYRTWADAEFIDCKQFDWHATPFIKLLEFYSETRSNVGIYVPNSEIYIRWLGACYASDRIAVPIFYGSSTQEVLNTILACDLQVLIYMPPFNVSEILNKCENGINFINVCTLDVISNNKPFAKSKAPADSAIMISTSGSIDNPKRAMLSKDNLLRNATDIIESLEYGESEVFMSILPLCFASANTSQMVVAFLLGAGLVTYRGILHPSAIAAYIKKYHVTSITLTPSLFKLIVDSPHFTCDRLPSLRTICFGGGPSDMNTIEKARTKFASIHLTQMYGQTETSARISHMRLQKDYWISESVGKPIGSMRVRIADEKGNPLPEETEGRIQVKGDSIFLGYYGQPELTKKAFVDGWLNTGDIGKLDKNGNIYIMGRERNLIIYCGFNIYPEEIENVLSVMEGVEDSLVYGEKDPMYGERITADIKIQEGHHLCTDDIMQHCAGYLPKHKLPSKIRFVDHMNKTSNGKKARKRA